MFTTAEICNKVARINTANEGRTAASKYARTVDGSMDYITQFWNNGYNKAFQNLLNRPELKPSQLRGVLKEMGICNYKAKTALKADEWNYTDLNGVHPSMFVEVENKKGEKVMMPAICKDVPTLDPEGRTTINAYGKEVPMYLVDANGKPVKHKEMVAIKAWTVNTIFDFIAQNQYAFEVEPLEEA